MTPDAGEDGPETTQDTALIRSWVEDHDGFPAHVGDTEAGQSEGQGDSGLLRIGFRDRETDEPLKEITWEQFAEEFERKDLAFVYPESDPARTRGESSLLVSAGEADPGTDGDDGR